MPFLCSILLYILVCGATADSLYSILYNMSLIDYTLQGEPINIVATPGSTTGINTNPGWTCYDPTNYRYYYLYQDVEKNPIRIGIKSYDLFNNVSLFDIKLNEYFYVHDYLNLENAFLLSCDQNNGDVYIFGTTISNPETVALYRVSFLNNQSLPYTKTLSYNITEITVYAEFNTLSNDNYITQPHVFNIRDSSIWFSHYYGDFNEKNNWIWYQINVLTGKIMNQENIVHFPNFTYLNYDMNRNKIIGGVIDTIDDIGTLTVNLYNPTDLSLYHSYGVIPNFYPCNGVMGVSTIDFTNNIWHIVHRIHSSKLDIELCDKTVITSIDIGYNNVTYLNSSSERICSNSNPYHECVYDIAKVVYYPIINVSSTIINQVINTTNDEFVSYTIDMSEIVIPSRLNISDPQLIYLTSQLSPSILRVGGTSADYTFYEVGDENPCKLPKNQSHGYFCYSITRFQELTNFAKKVGAKLVFGLSIGYPLFPTSDQSFWNSTNTRQFLRHLHDFLFYTNEDVWGWELGNEVSNNPYTDAEPQADAFNELHQILTEIWFEEMRNDPFYFKLLGFDNAGRTLYGNGNFTYYPVFVNLTCKILSGLTYHVYIGGSNHSELEPEWLDRQWEISNKVSGIFNPAEGYNLCADNPNDYDRISNNVIAGEIAYHSAENVPDVLLNTYIDGFWFTDVLGVLGNLGHAYIFRQTLAANGYGLIPGWPQNNYSYVHPDYYTALLAKELLSGKVIGIYSNQQHLRIYGRCLNVKYPMKHINILPESIKNGIVLHYVNLFFRTVNIELNKSIVYGLENTTDIYLWSLTAHNETVLQSKYMNLNGVKLDLTVTRKVPNLNGKLITDDALTNLKNKINITIPGTSYGWIVFTQTNIDACSN